MKTANHNLMKPLYVPAPAFRLPAQTFRVLFALADAQARAGTDAGVCVRSDGGADERLEGTSDGLMYAGEPCGCHIV